MNQVYLLQYWMFNIFSQIPSWMHCFQELSALVVEPGLGQVTGPGNVRIEMKSSLEIDQFG